MSLLQRVLPNTIRGLVSLCFGSATVLLLLFILSDYFIPFGFLAVVAFFAGLYLVVATVWSKFEQWLGWTQREQ